MGSTKNKEIKKARRKTIPQIRKQASKRLASSKNPKQKLPNETTKAGKSSFPSSLSPMLATLVDKPADKGDWLYEVKWDGYRALAFVNETSVELRSRNNKSFNDKFYPVKKALQELNMKVVLDGEIVVLNKIGISDFSALQSWRSEADGELVFYVFDILWYNDKNLMMLPLLKRKELLKQVLPQNDIIRTSESFSAAGKDFFELAKTMQLEGIIAKRADSEYIPGARTKDWLKIKANKRQEMVIGGYTLNEDSSKPFSSLLVGVYEGKELVYTGKVGTGFNIATQQELMRSFKPLVTKKVPFTYTPDINKPSRFRPNPPKAIAVWLKPKLVCEVSYAEITGDGIMRHPSFVGLRTDKKASDVVLEQAVRVDQVKSGKLNSKEIFKTSKNKERKTFLNPTEETQVRKVDGHELKFTNLSKVFWPKENFTKRDMLNYYYRMAPYILPYLKDRPQSLNRFPNGILGKSFYQKDVTGKVPSWIKTFLYHSETDNRDKHFLVPHNEAGILYMASLACIELNPWNSTIHTPDHPDWCIIDLDPDKNSFNQVIEAANVTKQILDSLNIPSYPKTSGSTGLHVYIPLGAKYTYEQSKEFARVIATMVHHEIPSFTSIERMVRNRKGKMYVDFLQNRPQATVAGPYCLRPKPGAPVSMPLHWDEVKKGLKITDFNITNAYDRVKETGDIFKPVLGKGINLEKIAQKFGSK
jgi:bifunctional non-homologous end joining protein LigD